MSCKTFQIKVKQMKDQMSNWNLSNLWSVWDLFKCWHLQNHCLQWPPGAALRQQRKDMSKFPAHWSPVPVKTKSLWLRWQKNIKCIKMRQNGRSNSHFTLFSEWPVGISGGGCVGQVKRNRVIWSRRSIVRNSYVWKTCDAKSMWRRRTYWNIDANISICISTSKFYQM